MIDAIGYIAGLRQAPDLSALPVGRRVVVIGGGMTAVDIAAQTKLLGAEEVTIVYRGGPEKMKASGHEQEFAQTRGVQIRYWAQPTRLLGEDGTLSAVEFASTAPTPDTEGAAPPGSRFSLPADMAFLAIGQRFDTAPFDSSEAPALTNGRIAVDADRRTSLPDVWAGGDCIDGGDDLTVSAVEDGKVAAAAIHRTLSEASDG